MGNKVFANGLNVSCKSGSAKVICAFPDVALSPPSPPAGPVPVPYPLTSQSGDTTKGSGKTKIRNKEVMLKDKSSYKKSMGDEAATKSLGMGVVNANLGGKVYFKMWSMDVKIEGENVVRATDITTSNHRSEIANASVPMLNAEKLAFGSLGPCKGVDRKFRLVPYKSKDPATNKKDLSCKRSTPPTTGHHLIPGRCMSTGPGGGYPAGCSHDSAPVICVDGTSQWSSSHKKLHAKFDPIEHAHAQRPPKGKMTYKAARDAAAGSVAGVKSNKKMTNKQLDCIKAQLDDYYKKCLDKTKKGDIAMNQKLNASSSGIPAQVLPPG